MAESNVKLLGKLTTPHVNRVQFALKFKGIGYEFLKENLAAKSELLLRSNPVYKSVPVLVDGGKPVCQSLLILEYIDEAWSSDGRPSILPSTPFDRAAARFWAAYIDEKWHPQMKELLNGTKAETKPGNVEKMVEGLALLEEVYVKSSNGKAYFGGDDIGYLDMALGCFLGWLKVAEIVFDLKILDESRFPGLTGWAHRFLCHEAVQGILFDTQKLLDIYRNGRGKVAAHLPK